MAQRTTLPPVFVIAAAAGGLLFILGGAVTMMSSSARLALISAALLYAALAAYTIYVVYSRRRLATRTEEMASELETQRAADHGLRARMSSTLRDPLTSIVGYADRMASEPAMPTDERRELLIEIRDSAREVEHVLADLAADDETLHGGPHTPSVVLLDAEVRSVASTGRSDLDVTTELGESRAWGDSAQVRQVLRTILGASADNGCRELRMKTETRGRIAAVSISSRSALLSAPGVAALTADTHFEDDADHTRRTLRSAHESVVAMGGTIGYAEVFGTTHVVLEFEAAPTDLGLNQPTSTTSGTPAAIASADMTYRSLADLRPERPTAAIRFS